MTNILPSCIDCGERMPNLDETSIFPECGHILENRCTNFGSNKLKKCKAASCKTEKSISYKDFIKIKPLYEEPCTSHSTLRSPICKLCNHQLSEMGDMYVMRCRSCRESHLYHYECAIEITKPRGKRDMCMCPMPDCIGYVTSSSIVKLNLTPDHHKDRPTSALQIIQKAFDVNATITKEAAEDLEMKIFISNIQKWESLKLKDRDVALKLFPFDDKKKLKQHCENCDHERLNILKKRLNSVTKLKKRYYEENKRMKELKVQLKEAEVAKVMLREANAQIVKLTKEKLDNEEMQEQISRNMGALEDNILEQSYQSKVNQLETENEALKTENEGSKTENEALKTENKALNTENETLKTENEVLKTENEALKTGNEAWKTGNEALKTENDALKTENEALKIENEQLKSDIASVSEEFAGYDAAITEFMLRQADSELQHETLLRDSYEQIDSLAAANDCLHTQIHQQSELLTRLLI